VLASEATYQAAADRVVAIQLPATPVKGKDEPVVMYSIRGAASTVPDSLELSIPVSYSAGSQQDVNALLTKAKRRSQGGFVFDMICPPAVSQPPALQLQPQLTELPDLPPLRCRIAKEAAGPIVETADFALVTLELDDADERTLALLEPGQLIQSPLESIEGMRDG